MQITKQKQKKKGEFQLLRNGRFSFRLFFRLTVKTIRFASLKQIEKKNHKDNVLFILVSSEIPCNLPIYHKEMRRICLEFCLHWLFLLKTCSVRI